MDTRMVVMVMDTAMDTAMDTPMTILMDTRTWMVDITILMIQVCVCQAKLLHMNCNNNFGGTQWPNGHTLEQAVQVWVLARVTVLCSWARHFSLLVPLSIQEYYYWLMANH